MTSNIYEQIVKEYYILEGYLTRSNIRGAKNTEIDLLAIRYNPLDKDYDVIWAEVTGKGHYLKTEQIFKKFSSELEDLIIELTGKEPKKIFYVYYLPDKNICEEVKKKQKISMIELKNVLKTLIKIARENVKKGKFPYSPASPLRSVLQTLIDTGLLE